MMGSWFDWGCWVSAGLLGVAALWMLWRAFLSGGVFLRRAGRVRRCPKCWYDLSASAAPSAESPVTCPECGRSVRREKDLHRTRRRMWLAIPAAAFVALGANLALVPSRPDTGWTRWLPTTVLIQIMPPFAKAYYPLDQDADRAAIQLAVLARANRVWDWQKRLLFGPDAIPSREDLLKCIQTRDVWLEGCTPRVRFSGLDARHSTFERKTTMRVLGISDGEVTRWTRAAWQSGGVSGPGVSLPSLFIEPVPESRVVEVEIETFLSIRALEPNWTLHHFEISLASVRTTIQLRFAPNLGDVIELVEDPKLDALLASDALCTAKCNTDGTVSFDLIVAPSTWPKDIAFRATPQLLYKDEPVGAALIDTDSPRAFQAWNRQSTMAVDELLRATSSGASTDWSIRLTSDERRAFFGTFKQRAWKGTVVVPLQPRAIFHPSRGWIERP